MSTVAMKCLYCNDYRIRCKGKPRACDQFPGKKEGNDGR